MQELTCKMGLSLSFLFSVICFFSFRAETLRPERKTLRENSEISANLEVLNMVDMIDFCSLLLAL